MEKAQLNNFIWLSFCVTVLDFAVSGQSEILFPRDRLIHIFISVILGLVFIYLIQYLKLCSRILRCLATLVFAARLVYLMCGFERYFQTFHGSNTLAIIIFTLAVIVMAAKITQDKTARLYIFFMLFNIILVVMIVVLGTDKLNAANIYINDRNFNFSVFKLYIFFDLLTIAVLTDGRKERVYVQKKYLLFSAVFLVSITLFQGLCAGGNMLYSLSPLQSLFQIFSGKTIKRVDYFFAVTETLNYFAAVILYTFAVKKCVVRKKDRYYEKN